MIDRQKNILKSKLDVLGAESILNKNCAMRV